MRGTKGKLAVVRKLPRNLILQIVGLTVFFWLYHLYAAYVISKLGIKLGVITAQTAPLYATRRTDFGLWVIPAFVVLAAYLIALKTFLEKRKIPAYILIPIFILLVVLIDFSVAMMDGGLKAVEEPYMRTGNEYYGDVPKINGIREFLRDYVSIFDTLSGHARTHPPGGEIFLWIVSRIFGMGLFRAAFGTVLFTSLTVIPVYFLTKDLYGEGTAKYALGLFLIAPNMVMFTATGMDGPFSVFPVLAMYMFYKALSGRTIVYSALTGLALGLGMFMNYTTAAIGVFIIVVTAITLFVKREKFRTAMLALLITGGAFVLFYVFLYVWARFNCIAAFRLAYKKDEASMGTGYENMGRYFNVSIANLFAFLIGVGIPLTLVWLREIVDEFRRIIRLRKVDIYILASFLTLIGISFSTLFTLEVERIWIFMVPFIVIPASKHLHEKCRSWEFYAVAVLLCVNMLVYEIFMYTYW